MLNFLSLQFKITSNLEKKIPDFQRLSRPKTTAAALFCRRSVAKNNAKYAPLQGKLDWACGPGGSDCSFDNTAAVTSLNPSYGNCKFPAR
ncbi:hypothetical protein QYF36_012724 [Acer negundo]|nr:hypothetical protein QYF36_012724 [Acer negundo]